MTVVPSVLYKYTSPEWATKMVATGAVRVGTLSYFRRIEAAGPERSDPQEGIRVTQTDGRAVTYTPETMPSYLKPVLGIQEGEKIHPDFRLQFAEGAVIINQEIHVDMYVYCASDRWDPALMSKFGGACVRINDPANFFDEIVSHLAFYDANGIRESVQFRVGPVEYRDRLETYPQVTQYDPVFRKPLSYASEHEVRAAWGVVTTGPRTTLTPVNLLIPNLTEYCKRIG